MDAPPPVLRDAAALAPAAGAQAREDLTIDLVLVIGTMGKAKNEIMTNFIVPVK